MVELAIDIIAFAVVATAAGWILEVLFLLLIFAVSVLRRKG
jgi:hypothetical protein